MLWRTLLSVAIALAATWAVLVLFLLLGRRKVRSIEEAVRLLPDTLRLLGRLATDRAVPKGIRVRLWLLFAYLAVPIDIIPDFIPGIGYADDAIIVCIVLRSVVRRAGADAIQRNWPGTADGLAALWRAAGVAGSPVGTAGASGPV